MKKLLTAMFALLILCPSVWADDSMLDMDMDFIDNPFGNQKPVTQQQFNEAVDRVKNQRRGIIQKFRDFLNRNKPENDPVLKNYKSDVSSEMGNLSAREINESKPNVVLSSSIIDSYGKIIPEGHYQIAYSNKDNFKSISFMQGTKLYGTLRAVDTTDNWESNQIIYARILYPTPSVARVIFSNLDVCVEGLARVAKPE